MKIKYGYKVIKISDNGDLLPCIFDKANIKYKVGQWIRIKCKNQYISRGPAAIFNNLHDTQIFIRNIIGINVPCIKIFKIKYKESNCIYLWHNLVKIRYNYYIRMGKSIPWGTKFADEVYLIEEVKK